MNRIYELAKEAGMIEFDSIPGSNAVTPDYTSVVKAQKFAELILTEVIATIYRTDISDRKQEQLVSELTHKFGLDQ